MQGQGRLNDDGFDGEEGKEQEDNGGFDVEMSGTGEVAHNPVLKKLSPGEGKRGSRSTPRGAKFCETALGMVRPKNCRRSCFVFLLDCNRCGYTRLQRVIDLAARFDQWKYLCRTDGIRDRATNVCAGHFDTEAIGSMLAVFGHEAHAPNVFVALKNCDQDEDRLGPAQFRRNKLPPQARRVLGVLLVRGHYAAFEALLDIKTCIIFDDQQWPIENWIPPFQYILYKHRLGKSNKWDDPVSGVNAGSYEQRSEEDWCLISTASFNHLIDNFLVAGFNRRPIALRGDGNACGVIALTIVRELLLVHDLCDAPYGDLVVGGSVDDLIFLCERLLIDFLNRFEEMKVSGDITLET